MTIWRCTGGFSPARRIRRKRQAMRDRRRFGRPRAALGMAMAVLLVPLWLARRGAAKRKLEARFFAQILRSFGLTLELRGEPARPPGTLYVSNHISWTDIAAYGVALDAAFVAKAEVAAVPFARGLRPVFVERNRIGEADAQADAVRARLRREGVILFAEGTTSDGARVLPFRTSLFAATDAAARVQPVALAYLDREGRALDPQRLADIAWIGEQTWFPSAARMARWRARAVLIFLPPLDPADFPDRKALAAAARAAIAEAYAAAPNRSR